MWVQMPRDTTASTAPLQHLQDAVPSQCSVLSQPHPRQVSQTVPCSRAQIAIQITGCTDTEEYDRWARAFPDQTEGLILEIQVLKFHRGYLTASQAGVEHQPQDRSVPTILEVRPPAGVEQPSLLV